MASSTQDTFDALADSTRRKILAHLAEHDELSAGDIADRVSLVSRTGVSSHLRILRSAGLVQERKMGRYRLYSLTPDGPVRDALTFLNGLLGTAMESLTETGHEAVPSAGQRQTA